MDTNVMNWLDTNVEKDGMSW